MIDFTLRRYNKYKTQELLLIKQIEASFIKCVEKQGIYNQTDFIDFIDAVQHTIIIYTKINSDILKVIDIFDTEIEIKKQYSGINIEIF